jgi:hypothetical protein
MHTTDFPVQARFKATDPRISALIIFSLFQRERIVQNCVANPLEKAILRAGSSFKEKISVYEKNNLDENGGFGSRPGFVCGLCYGAASTAISPGNAAATRVGSHFATTRYDVRMDAGLLGLAGRTMGVGTRLLVVPSTSGRCLGARPLDTSWKWLHLGAAPLAVSAQGLGRSSV